MRTPCTHIVFAQDQKYLQKLHTDYEVVRENFSALNTRVAELMDKVQTKEENRWAAPSPHPLAWGQHDAQHHTPLTSH